MSTDTGDTFRAQYESEERDRALIRKEIERGVPEEQIEEEVAFQTDFVRLNPGRDVRAYARHLIEEENTASSLDLSLSVDQGKQDFKREFGFEPRKRDTGVSNDTHSQPTPIPSVRTRTAEEFVRSYINENFKQDDWLAVVALNRKSGVVSYRSIGWEWPATPQFEVKYGRILVCGPTFGPVLRLERGQVLR